MKMVDLKWRWLGLKYAANLCVSHPDRSHGMLRRGLLIANGQVPFSAEFAKVALYY